MLIHQYTRRTASALAVLSLAAAIVGCDVKFTKNESVSEPVEKLVPQAASIVEIESLTPEQRLAVLAMQGIANRKGPRVFLQTGQAIRWNQIEYDRNDKDKGGANWNPEDVAVLRPKYANTCDYWIDYCKRIGMSTFSTASMAELFNLLGDELRGAILYGKLDEDLAIAGTMAGVEDAVPMTEEIYNDLCKQTGRKIPVVFDVRTLYPQYPAGADKRIEAHRWAVKNLLQKCDRSAALSRDKTYQQDAHDTLIDSDLAIRNRWMIFDLSFMSSETRLGKDDKPNPVWGFDPPDKPLLIEIIRSLNKPYPAVYGWGRPYESALIRRLAIDGGVKICTGNGNASFFQSMPPKNPVFKQPVPHVEKVTLEKKVYVAFAVNEGDTLKYLTGLTNGGGWLQSERGTVPINWGVDPMLCEKFPGLVSHYYRTATPQDYFFSAPSGWGYLAPIMLPAQEIPVYGELVRKGGLLADTRYIDVWWMAGLRERGLFFPYLSAMGMRGLTQWSKQQEVEFAPDGTPIVHSNMYYIRKSPSGVAEMIKKVKAETGAPWFVFVYGGSPHWFAGIAKELPENEFKVVKMDEFFETARLARPAIQGRTYRVPANETTEAP